MSEGMTRRIGEIRDPVKRQAYVERLRQERIERRRNLIDRLRALAAGEGPDGIYAEMLQEIESKAT